MSSATAGTSKNVHPQTAPAKPIRNLAALSRLRARARQLHLFDGLVGLGRAVLLAAAASFVLDYLLDLPWGVRLFFLMVGLSLLVAWTAARLVRPLSRVIPDESLALLVEASNPDLHQSLITAIELTRPGVEGARHVSADLIASVVADVESRAREIAFDRIFRLRHLRRRAVLLGILTGAILVLSIASPGLASIWLERNLLLRGTKWPKETILQQYPPIPETVAVGDDLLVEVRVLRGDPRTVALESETPSAARRTYPMLRKEKASWDVRIVEAGGD
ncbi:MAG: hypothetical protein JXA90_06425, partial [Planctomycetes bacterium]|nr:hypothetical protein [Planctomycetota bacterium]